MTEHAERADPSLDAALARAIETLLRTQQVSGYWQRPLEAHAIMEAELIFLYHLLGRDEPALERRLADRLLSLQDADGGWPLSPGGPGDPSVTIEAYYALRLAGHAAEEPALVRARDFILACGGLAVAVVSTRLWLALFGQYPWVGVPELPVEIVLVPPWVPLNIYALASWMRSAIVPVALLLANRDALAVRGAPAVPELWVHHPPHPGDLAFPRSPELVTWRNAFLTLERAFGLLGRHPWQRGRRRAVARAIEWLLRHQDANGHWGGNLPATIYTLVALHAVGFAPDHPVMVSGFAGVHDFLVEHERTLIAQPALSTTRDTVLAARTLLDAGVDPEHTALARAADWLLTNQIFRPGDWAVARPDLEPGGWSSGRGNDWYPETNVSAGALAVLAALPVATMSRGRRALAYGVNWTLGMQSRSGGWAVCDPDEPPALLDDLPFAPERETVTDQQAADVTGEVLVLAAAAGFGTDLGRVRRACEWLRRAQQLDGSFAGRCGPLHATWCALAGLAAVGADLQAAEVRRAVEWLVGQQQADGGWGASSASGAIASTPTRTAWAILGLLATGDTGRAVERGIAYLVRTQGGDGTWEERAGTAPGFGRCPTHRQHLAALCYPLMALGQYRTRTSAVAAGPHAD